MDLDRWTALFDRSDMELILYDCDSLLPVMAMKARCSAVYRCTDVMTDYYLLACVSSLTTSHFCPASSTSTAQICLNLDFLVEFRRLADREVKPSNYVKPVVDEEEVHTSLRGLGHE